MGFRVLQNILVVMVLLLCMSSPAAAEMTSLREWAAQPKDQREASYPLIRCAGMYQGLYHYVVKGNLSEDQVENFERLVEVNSLAALVVLKEQRKGATREELVDRINRLREQMARLYIQRIQQAHAAGQDLTSDYLIKNDLIFCKAVAEVLSRVKASQ